MSGYFDALNRRRRTPLIAPAAPLPPAEPLPPAAPGPAVASTAAVAPIPDERTLVARPPYTRAPVAPTAPAPYQALRERLLVAANGRSLKTIVFAGCRGGEGCSQVVRDLASILAGSGLDVLLVDADRRGSELAPEAMTSSPDLSELVERGGEPSANVCGNGRLTVVQRRAAATDREYFYRAPQFATWMAAQRENHDYVLLDAPPLLSFADATMLGRVADGAVIVAEAETTERESLTHAADQLRRAGVKVIGVVLNRARNPVPAFLRPYLSNS